VLCVRQEVIIITELFFKLSNSLPDTVFSSVPLKRN
jgi:hypothetical protein